jgi:hypothetical protein
MSRRQHGLIGALAVAAVAATLAPSASAASQDLRSPDARDAARATAAAPMRIDATALTSTSFLLSRTSAPAETMGVFQGTSVETVDLIAGDYQFVMGAGLVMRCAVAVTSAGAWDYATACDGFLAGRGTDTLQLAGYAVTIDATPLATPLVFTNLFSLSSTSQEPFRGPRQVRLMPTFNDYLFTPGPGVVGECAFGVGLDGLIAYPDRFEGCLSGRGTRTVTFNGFPINVDARQLSTTEFNIIQAFTLFNQPSGVVQTYRLLPPLVGSYGSWQAGGVVWPSLGLTVDFDGHVGYPSSADGWVTGRGTDTLVIHGYPVEIDATATAPGTFRIPDAVGTGTRDRATVQALRLAPVAYAYSSGAGTDFFWSIREQDGTVDFGTDAGSCVLGRGTTRLTVGCRLSVSDATVEEPPSGRTTIAYFRVSLPGPAPVEVKADYATADGSATAPADYTATSGTLTIDAGNTTALVGVPVGGDGAAEPDEQFTLALSNPQGAGIDRGVATGTIQDATPPDTVITAGPPEGGTVRTAPTFEFEAIGPAARFECNATWDPPVRTTGFYDCTSPHTVEPPVPTETMRLRFEVRAVDARGNADPTPAVRSIYYQPPQLDLSVDGIEITQGVQERDCRSSDGCRAGIMVPDYIARARGENPARRYQGVVLSEAKPAIARVYVQARGQRDYARGATVRLHGFDSIGRPLAPGFLLPQAGPDIPPACCPALSLADRRSARSAYTFTLPPDWSRHRALRLRAVVSPQAGRNIVETRRLDNELWVGEIPFKRPTTIRLRPVEMRIRGIQPDSPPTPFIGARMAFPDAFDIPTYYQGVVDATDAAQEPDRKEQVSKALELVDDWADDKDYRSGVYPYGLYQPGHGLVTGATRGDTALYQDRTASYAPSGGRPLTAVAHEMGHGLGLAHAGLKCGSNSNGQVGWAWSPDDEGRTNGFGLDTRAFTPYRILGDVAPANYDTSPNPTDGTAYWDLMSYCPTSAPATDPFNENVQWLSPRNWTHLLNYYAPAHTLPARAAATRAAATRAAASVPALAVWAFLDDSGAVSIQSVRRIDAVPTASLTESPWHVAVRDAAGRTLSDTGVTVTTIPSHEAGIARVLRAKVPAAGAASVQIVREGTVVAERQRSAHAPRVQILSPRRGARIRGRQAVLRWRASDADGDALTVSLDYSADAGRRWSTIYIGRDRGRVTLPTRLLTGSRNARLRVRANDGFNATAKTSGRFVSEGAPPVVSILAPVRGIPIRADATLVAEGDAYDDAGRRLGGRSLTWRLGARVVGHGRQVSKVDLPAGRRRLQLSARDRRGRVGSASVTVRVLPVAPRFVVLNAPRSISREALRLGLRVATNVTATLRIGGQRFHVGRSPRSVTVRVRPGRRPLRLRAVLSAGGPRSTAVLVVRRRG